MNKQMETLTKNEDFKDLIKSMADIEEQAGGIPEIKFQDISTKVWVSIRVSAFKEELED